MVKKQQQLLAQQRVTMTGLEQDAASTALELRRMREAETSAAGARVPSSRRFARPGTARMYEDKGGLEAGVYTRSR
jgi:hypothetical protein